MPHPAVCLASNHTRCTARHVGVFSAGVPAAFHANYRAALAFLDGLEAYCASQAQVQGQCRVGS